MEQFLLELEILNIAYEDIDKGVIMLLRLLFILIIT